MKDKVLILISNLLLIFFAGALLKYSYNYLIENINEPKPIKNQQLNYQAKFMNFPETEAVQALLKNTPGENNTQLATKTTINFDAINKINDFEIDINEPEKSFWESLPPWSTIFFSGIAIFFGRLISNFADNFSIIIREFFLILKPILDKSLKWIKNLEK